MRVMKRTMVALTLIFGMAVSFALNGIGTVYADGIAEQAVYYELGEKCKGKTTDGNVYYEVTLNKKSNISMKISTDGRHTVSGNYPGIVVVVYDDKGKLAVEESAFDFKENTIKGKWNAKAERILKKGTYYIEVHPRYYDQRYSFIFSKKK